MASHSFARTNAETQFERTQRQAREGAEARAEHDAKSAAVNSNTARLRELRLEKERSDKEALALATPPAPKKTRVRKPKAV